jgi:hypothetical protein
MKAKIKKFLIKTPILLNFILFLRDKLFFLNPYGTHKYILKKVLKNLLIKKKNITIVEVGSGENSTIFFSKFIKSNNGSFFSFENNREYFDKIAKKVINTNKINYVVNIKYDPNFYTVKNFEGNIDLLFIDSSPFASREEILNYFKNKAQIIILHDCDYFPNAGIFGKLIRPIKNDNDVGYRNYDDVFKSWYEYFPKRFHGPTGPPTLVGSNLIDIREYI